MPRESWRLKRSNPKFDAVLVDVCIQRVLLGRDISPRDTHLAVQFCRKTKSISSKPTRWDTKHVAVWNEHIKVNTQFYLNPRAKTPSYISKDFDIFIVAMPSKKTVAQFLVDFSDVIRPNVSHRFEKVQLSPIDCQDLTAMLEMDIIWQTAVDEDDEGDTIRDLSCILDGKNADLKDIIASPSQIKQRSTYHAEEKIPPISPSRQYTVETDDDEDDDGDTIRDLSGVMDTMRQSSASMFDEFQLTSREFQLPRSASVGDRHRLRANRLSNTSDRVSAGTTSFETVEEDRKSKESVLNDLLSARLNNLQLQLREKESKLKQCKVELGETQARLKKQVKINEQLSNRDKVLSRRELSLQALNFRLIQELESICAQNYKENSVSSPKNDMQLQQQDLLARVKKYHDEIAAHESKKSSQHSHRINSQVTPQWNVKKELSLALKRNQLIKQQLDIFAQNLDLYDIMNSDDENSEGNNEEFDSEGEMYSANGNFDLSTFTDNEMELLQDAMKVEINSEPSDEKLYRDSKLTKCDDDDSRSTSHSGSWSDDNYMTTNSSRGDDGLAWL